MRTLSNMFLFKDQLRFMIFLNEIKMNKVLNEKITLYETPTPARKFEILRSSQNFDLIYFQRIGTTQPNLLRDL